MIRRIRYDRQSRREASAGGFWIRFRIWAGVRLDGVEAAKGAGCACFHGWTQPSQVLCIERAQSSRNSRADPHYALLHSWSQQCNPKLTAKKQVGPTHG